MRTLEKTEIYRALEGDRQLALVDSGKVYRGRCPACEKKTVWIGKDQPYRLRCDRENKCGYDETIKERYPELYANFAERFPTTADDPKATARAYMEVKRGLSGVHICNQYSQGLHKLKNGQAADTVKFNLCEGMTWERIIEDAHIKIDNSGKARIKQADYNAKEKASYSGKCWVPQGQEIQKGDTVYITEGIFCALALTMHGYKAVAAITSGNFPRELFNHHLGDEIKWALAYDNDAAAHKYLQKYTAQIDEAGEKFEVFLCRPGEDWNDAHLDEKLTPEFMAQCNWRGRIFIAPTAKKCAYALYGQSPYAKTVFTHRHKLYAAKFSQEEFSRANEQDKFEFGFCWDAFNQACRIENVANCEPEFIYVQQNKLTEERTYFFKIYKADDSRTFYGAFSPNALTDARAFSNALLSYTDGSTFDGGAGELKILRNRWLNKKVMRVESVAFIGYDESHRAYVFQNFGYQNGRLIELNDYGYLPMKDGGIKTTLISDKVVYAKDFNSDWLGDFITVFGCNGLAALGFFTASLFARQIKEKQQSLTFLELTGDAGAGKSTLLRFLWKLLGRDNYEGVDLLSLSKAAYGRLMGKVSNMPMVAIESDRDAGQDKGGRKQNMANWDEFKKVYDLDGVIDSRGVKTSDNTTLDRVFRGTLVISQNDTVQASEAMLSRIVHLHAHRANVRVENRAKADELKTTDINQLAGYLGHAICAETAYLERYFLAFSGYRKILTRHKDIENQRVMDCHAQVMAAVDALQVLLPISQDKITDVVNMLAGRAVNRQQRLIADHPNVQQFWDTYEYLNTELENATGGEKSLNHSCDASTIAINLNEYAMYCRDYGQERPDLQLLKELLPRSQARPLIAAKGVRSRIERKPKRCWVFAKSKIDLEV